MRGSACRRLHNPHAVPCRTAVQLLHAVNVFFSAGLPTVLFFRNPLEFPLVAFRPNVQSLQTGGNTLVLPSNPQPHPNHRSHVGPNALGPDRTLFEAFWMPSA